MEIKEGRKFDNNKLRWDLLPIEPIEEIIKICMYGVSKYGENTWQNLENGRWRYYNALMRHITAWHKGEKLDTESGLSHLSHALWNAMALSYFEVKDTQ